jgi:molybdopterin molybdotransferase
MTIISVDDAWDRIRRLAKPLPTEWRAIDQAAGGVLAETVTAPMDLPPFDNSAMDGYALRVEDTAAACEAEPVRLKISGEVAAGGWSQERVPRGSALRIMTGAPVPPGADAVLMLEAARLRDGVVEIREPVPAGKHIRRRGEDVHSHEVLVNAGARLNAQRLGLLANSGVAQMQVHRTPRVSLLATGSELVPAGMPLKPGQIYDSNRIVLRRLLERTGSELRDLGIAVDDADTIRERILAGLSADVLLISGGVSVGAHDHVKSVLQELGVETVFWRVDMKPGKPLLCGRLGQRWVFGLPGNPISCVVGFLVFIEPLLRRLQGEPQASAEYVKAELTNAVQKADSRRHFMTATLTHAPVGRWRATATEKQGSAMMRAMAQANAFLVVPEACMRLDAGTVVDVLPFEG